MKLFSYISEHVPKTSSSSLRTRKIYISCLQSWQFRWVKDTLLWYDSLFIVRHLWQILIVAIQAIFGPRSIVPSCFLPPRYNYFKKVELNTTSHEDVRIYWISCIFTFNIHV
jgi:hypothetical protein